MEFGIIFLQDLMFEQMLGYANHLGLYAEETGPAGEALGNFPIRMRLMLVSGGQGAAGPQRTIFLWYFLPATLAKSTKEERVFRAPALKLMRMGNFPQAFSHLALIAAAITLDAALGEQD